MKKILFCSFLLTTVLLNAQIEKGNWMVGSTIALSKFEFTKSNTTIDVTMNPNAQLFLSDRIALGAGLDINYSYSRTDSNASSFNWGIGPSLRYFFYREDRGGAFGNIKLFFGGNRDGNSSFNPELNFGYDFVLNNFLALELFTGYGVVIPFKGSELTHRIPIGIGFQIFLAK
jgi:hypothetical protein